MPERMDPPRAPKAPADPEPMVSQPRWRRPTLLVTGASLLTLGAFINADRIGLGRDEGIVVADAPPDPSPTTSQGEEGKMGEASVRQKSGLYAMRGPRDAVPRMERSFVPEPMGSPAGGAFAVGPDDEDVWGGLTGSEVGAAYGTGGLGLIGVGRGGGGVGYGGPNSRDARAERYALLAPNKIIATAADPKSTFSIDVDTASYSNVRRFLVRDNQLPPPASVRTEELINYFNYDYAQPSSGAPFSVTTEVGPCPWNADNRLVHIGVQGKTLDQGATPPRNLVFLIDVSGSMSSADKLPLVTHGLAALTEQLDGDDRVSIVVYAGAAGVVLPPTSGADKRTILTALDRLEAGGSTNGGRGIELAYSLAERAFIKGGVNRVVLASDGDFNVGVSSHAALIRLVEAKRKTGVSLSVLGVGTGNLNDHMMEQIADKGNGNYAYIDGMFEARKVLVEQSGATLVTIAKDVKIQVEFDADQVSTHRLVGYENRVMAHREFDDDSKDAGEIGAGHTVTAIYEVAPTGRADDDDDAMMLLNLRYKQPDGERSRKLTVEVRDGGQQLADTSNDYRFSAAVAAFGEGLLGAQGLRYAELLALAEGSLGDDPHCYRHGFLELVWTAARLSGEDLAAPEWSCTAHTPRSPEAEAEVEAETSIEVEERGLAVADAPDREQEGEGWQAFALEVLRLLPPFLALPMFFMALRRPRRRR